MDFLVGYRDPLFGLIIFFGLIFIISFFSYAWGLLKNKKQKNSLEQFFERFDENAKSEPLRFSGEEKEKEALAQLAKAYMKNGDFEKAIGIYLQLKESTEDMQERVLILKQLAKLYYKAGFLARSIEIYEEILRYFPRSADVLFELMLIYEKMNDMQNALKIKEALDELGHTSSDTNYLMARKFIVSNEINDLVTLYKEHPALVRVIFTHLFKTDPQKAWRVLDPKDYEQIVDILWRLPKDQIRTDHPFLQALYTAKGYGNFTKRSDIFEFDVLMHYPNADLDFEYLCPKCKNIFPFAYSRCPNCQSVESPKVELILRPKEEKREESFSV